VIEKQRNLLICIFASVLSLLERFFFTFWLLRSNANFLFASLHLCCRCWKDFFSRFGD
jgi:hypothetical protein